MSHSDMSCSDTGSRSAASVGVPARPKGSIGARGVGRRDVLAGLAALGAGALLPGAVAIAQGRPHRRIDVHSHFFSPGWKRIEKARAAAGKGFASPANQNWTVEETLADMQKGGVTNAVLSLASIPDNWFGGDPRIAASLAHECNEYVVELAKAHPGRFGYYCSLPMIDVEASLKEIEYGYGVMKCDGIGLCSSYGDKWPGDQMFKPIFDELNRRKAVVYFPPTTPNCCHNLIPGMKNDAMLEVPFDTSRAIVSLLVSGTFARCRDIKWVFAHSGGSLPSLAGRIDVFMKRRKDLAKIAPYGAMAELQRLHFDTANGAWAPSMAGLTKIVPFSQIMFGSDFPYFPTAMTAAGLQKEGYGRAAMDQIDFATAEGLMPRLRTLIPQPL
jgi:predicted TIM-barrel fold metal-dependent hydrolase